MEIKSKKNQIYSGNAKVDSVYHTAEWLLTAFASTLIFIIFVMQVYRIPTGSMAETLRGAHFRVRCAQCGYRYDHDFIAQRYKKPDTFTPSYKLPIGPSSRCPSCGYIEPNPIASNDGRIYIVEDGESKPAYYRTVFKGDQIFVLKSIYQFFQPKRWDVIVFKNPLEPRINYIKRCIALPGEKLEIFDGDIYINGEIQRKPDRVQEELWMVVYDNSYQPTDPADARFNGHPWKQPFENLSSSQWNLSFDDPTVFGLGENDGAVHRIQYNDQQGNDFQATYAYDSPGTYPSPICSDLMVRYYLEMQNQSAAGAQISKYGNAYQGWIYADGTMKIVRITSDGEPIVLEKGVCVEEDLRQLSRFRFATIDHQVVLEFGSVKLVHDLGLTMDAAGRDISRKPEVEILGSGTLRLAHVALFRDIFYISSDEDGRIQRASRDNPMILGEEEYFACGDNSPCSLDSRLWDREGLGNNGQTYRAGVVPKDYLVGKAFFVHWPGGYRLGREPIRWIPFIDGMKVIYGGNE